MAITGTKEWAEHSFNCCVGCAHDCKYCYARSMAIRYGRSTIDRWSVEQPKYRKPRLFDGRVMFPTTHDITETNRIVCERVLSDLLHVGNTVLVVSKPSSSIIRGICDRHLLQRDQIMFRFTIGAESDSILSFWEPGAPSFSDRLSSLKIAYDHGYATSVSCEPLLEPENVLSLVSRVSPFVTDSIWIGKLNQLLSRTKNIIPPEHPEISRIMSWQTDEKVRQVYDSLRDNPLIRWKESYKAVVGIDLASTAGQDI